MFSSTTKIGEFTNLESRITNCRITLFHHERHRYIYVPGIIYLYVFSKSALAVRSYERSYNINLSLASTILARAAGDHIML